ncbi:unnamed protein product [Lymnaea stagnalis]|uniref:KH homology domain-containing protein 4 n=1 Tax=Lymnaea stagnalis TaxID=6523 RepID=A0AAV2HHB0_LYMST
MYNHGTMFSLHDQEDKSSLEAAAEAAAKVNAMLIAKGMLKPNQIHSATNVITKKSGGPNSLVVAEVEINNLTTPCRNTLTRGTTQEEISKASGAAVTTRGRYMAPEEKARNPRDRCLYLNVQAATKESVDIAVLKINEIIRSMCGNKVEVKSRGVGQNRAGRIRPSFRPNTNNGRFGFRGHPPPPLMSLPTPPPPQVQITHNQPPPQTVTILQENLYIGLEHAPPNFDTKNKILGPGGSYLMHIQAETGAAVSLRGKSSGFLNMSALESIEPMHVHLEHHSFVAIQEAKKLAENLIQTVQQLYVSFQQALAALPASLHTGLITGVPQQPPYVETQMGLTTIAMTEQTLHALQPQGQSWMTHKFSLLGPPMLMPPGSVANQFLTSLPNLSTNAGQTLMIPSSISLTSLPMMNQMPVSASSLLQQPTHIDLGGQQQIMLSQPPPGTPHALTPVGLHQMVPAPCPVQQPLPSHYGTYTHVQPTMHLVSQPVSMASHALVQQNGPPMLTQGPQHILAPQVFLISPQPCVHTTWSPSGRGYNIIPTSMLLNIAIASLLAISLAVLIYKAVASLLAISMSELLYIAIASLLAISLAELLYIAIASLLAISLTELLYIAIASLLAISMAELLFIAIASLLAISLAELLYIAIASLLAISLAELLYIAIASLLAISMAELPPSRGAPSNGGVLMPPPPPPSNLASQPTENRKEDDLRTMPPPKSTDLPWGSGSRRRGISPSPSEPDKKKMRGILKNKHVTSQQDTDKELSELTEVKLENEDDDKRHPASPQYQGQPLRYPSMPSDPNLPPNCQDSGVPHQHRPLPQPIPTTLPPGHHLVHQADPNLPQVHIAHPHVHIEGSRSDVQPAQIVIEHPGVPGTPIHITHHRVTAPGQIHIEHTLTGQPPRQMLLEHQAQTTLQLEHQPVPLPGHGENLHIPGQPPTSQEMYEFELGAQQQAPPQYQQTFEHITVSQASQPGEHLLAPGSAVIVSSTQHYPQYSVAISTAAPPPPVSYSLPTSSPFAMQSQHSISQHIQRLPDQQHMSMPPPQQSSYTMGITPSPPHFQPHFAGMQSASHQSIPAHLFHQTQQPPPPPPPSVSQHQYQTHPQGISYWVSQT